MLVFIGLAYRQLYIVPARCDRASCASGTQNWRPAVTTSRTRFDGDVVITLLSAGLDFWR
jgi:hypothetical protein